MQRNGGKPQNGKDQKSLQENWRKQGKIECKDGHDKGQSGLDLTEAEETKKRWKEYTEELYKISVNDFDNHDVYLTKSQTSWSMKSSGPSEALL